MSHDPTHFATAVAGADPFEQPSLFYLTNQNLSEEWPNLRTNVAAGLDEWYSTTLRNALHAPAAGLSLHVALARGPGWSRNVRRRHGPRTRQGPVRGIRAGLKGVGSPGRNQTGGLSVWRNT
jgi:hypothetical protein